MAKSEAVDRLWRVGRATPLTGSYSRASSPLAFNWISCRHSTLEVGAAYGSIEIFESVGRGSAFLPPLRGGTTSTAFGTGASAVVMREREEFRRRFRADKAGCARLKGLRVRSDERTEERCGGGLSADCQSPSLPQSSWRTITEKRAHT
jgi:hypothetical protein